MIVDALESDWPLIEGIAVRAGVLEDEEMDALAAVWEEYVLLGAEDSGYQFLVDRADGAVLGFVCYGPRDLTDGVQDVYYLMVEPARCRQGIGRRLLRAAEAEAREARARMTIVEMPGRMSWRPGREFLAAAGYQVEAAIKDFYAVGDDLAVFVKRF